MDWILKLIEKHTKDGVLDQESLTKAINKEFPKHAVPKDTYNALSETKKKLEKDISDRDEQLEGLKKVDAEGLKEQIEKLQEENKTAKEKHESEMKDLNLTNAIKLKISGKVHDEDLVAGLFDKEKLILNDDGSITGLDDQYKNISENKPFLLKEIEPAGTGGSLGGGPKGSNEPKDSTDEFMDAIFENQAKRN
ncbi:phage scaffolding protein [Clostridium sp. D2Q-14]|uniref:phage scaffolding protein n=1 Tax=Anaeromonas gelatinilytica TaxID=2683194 RepID=UPI00193BB598|nr:phage scaffolding protein [Anaeromonas gelatinilytica]MBS4536815.1 phage scaffolding protein [Anaeromonas gelatinilytica]